MFRENPVESMIKYVETEDLAHKRKTLLLFYQRCYTYYDMKVEINSYEIFALREVDKIKIMWSHGFNMKLLVKNGLAFKKDMADFSSPKKVKPNFFTMKKHVNSNVY